MIILETNLVLFGRDLDTCTLTLTAKATAQQCWRKGEISCWHKWYINRSPVQCPYRQTCRCSNLMHCDKFSRSLSPTCMSWKLPNLLNKEMHIIIFYISCILYTFLHFRRIETGLLRHQYLMPYICFTRLNYIEAISNLSEDFILRWGTHYVKYSRFGGQLKLIKTIESLSTDSFSTFKHRAQNEFKRMTGVMSSNAAQVSWLAKISGSVGGGYEPSSSSDFRDYHEKETMRLLSSQ